MELSNSLNMQRCPSCNIANPNITKRTDFNTTTANNGNKRIWIVYICSSCGGAIMGSRNESSPKAIELFPKPITVDPSIPEKAAAFLSQSLETIHAPAGSIMLSASSIDAMLKDKGYKEGSLYTRIDQAAKDHLITEGMAKWAHQIRLEANDHRHADEHAKMPTEEDAKRILEFAFALGEFLYVLPDKVARGIERSIN